MSEKPSFKDMAAMETSSVDAAFDPELRQAEKELRQAEKDWNDYLAHRKAAQGELDKNGKLRNIDGTFKNVEPNKERNNRLYDESLENTSRDSMGLVSLAKAAREAREQGDKTTQINIEDEIQERLIVSAEQNGWTSEQTDGMLNRLLAIMHGEGGIASVSNDNEVNPVEPAGTDEEVIALPGPAEAEPNKDADQADDAKAAEPAGEGNPYNRPVAFENSLVPVVDEVEPWMKTWPGYGDKDGADKTEESKEPSQEEAPKFGSTPLIPADFLLTRLKQLDEQGGDWEGEYEKYTDAWEAYTTAHANARLNDVGSIIDRFATDKTKVGSWVKRTRDALGSKFNTRGHRRRQALADFEPRYLKAHEMALDEYGKLRDMTPVERELSSMLLHGDTLKTLEGEISRKRMNADQSRSFVSRKVGSILGIGAAVGLGALSAMLEDESKGQGNHLKWLTLGTVAGASAGYAAARRSRKGETQADINRRVVEGRDTMAYIAEDGGDITKMALALDAIETTTNAEQDKNRDRVAKITALGAGAAWASHLGVEATETIADSGFFYNDTGTEANPWGVDFDPRDGNIDIIPDPGNIGGEGDSSLGDAATNTREALDAQVDEIVSSQPDVPVDTTVEVPEDATNPEIVDNTADTTSGGTQDDTGEVLGSQGGATEVYIQEDSSFTQETMELYPHLTVEQARDMYVDLMKTYRPEDIFSGVEFYRIEEGEWAGQWGMRDTGSATLTSTGRDAMNEWINANAQRGV